MILRDDAGEMICRMAKRTKWTEVLRGRGVNFAGGNAESPLPRAATGCNGIPAAGRAVTVRYHRNNLL